MALEYDRILNRTIQGTTTGVLLNATLPSAYPVFTRFATFSFDFDSAVIALVLSSSMVNTSLGVMAVIAARGDTENINLTQVPDPRFAAADIFLTQLTHQNSTLATTAPASRTTAVAFSPSVAVIEFKSGDSISVYGAADNDATALMAATLSIYYIPV